MTFMILAMVQAPLEAITVRVDCDKVEHRMAGGIGASWHAMSREFKIDPKDMHGWKDTLNSRGSAWGGNPPLEWESSWKQICEHASWLGMNWMRVEFSQRMYEPQRGEFDWDNEEMQALYRILDWCQKNDVDVFLTQMWGFVDWNAFDGVHPLQSAPRSVEDFAGGFATAVEHLVKVRGYTCIRWLCIVNEPNLWLGWWLGPDKKPMTIMPALKAVRAALDKRGVGVPLSAPDWNNLGIEPRQVFDVDANIELGAFDAHNYGGPQPRAIEQMAEWVKLARRRGIPFFLSEMGDMRLGWKYSHTGPKSYAAALSNAETILRGIRIGVDAFNRWSFTNRGDLDGQWQLVRTWDMEDKRYSRDVTPEPVPYYCYAILTRFCARHSEVLKTDVRGGSEVIAAALRSPKGNLTTYILNKSRNRQDVKVVMNGLDESRTLYRYQVTEPGVAQAGFTLDPVRTSLEEELPARSITTFSTYNLSHLAPGVIAE
jgi:sugar phosphate isomerase/epimerase